MAMYIVDRLEELLAVIEVTEDDDRTHYITVSCSELPADVQEGDLLSYEENVWAVDVQATMARREKLKQRFLKLGK